MSELSLAFAESLYWTRIKADQGLPGAQNEMGELHEEGLGVPQDYGKALQWYRRAARNGHGGAREWLKARSLKW